jgi:hypothetical protein
MIRSNIFEDNQPCYLLATTDPPRVTSRSRSIAIRYHWFREHLRPGKIEIAPIASQEQLPDIFTKPLPPLVFEPLRKELLGW